MAALSDTEVKALVDRLKASFEYDSEIGSFVRIRNTTRGSAGTLAGTRRQDGYCRILVAGREYYAHRLAWLYVYGTMPKVIDHIDRNPSNNAIANLREVTHAQNMQNQVLPMSNNRSGLRGVSFFNKTRCWRARISVDGVSKTIGYYKTIEEAQARYLEARRIVHPFAPI